MQLWRFAFDVNRPKKTGRDSFPSGNKQESINPKGEEK